MWLFRHSKSTENVWLSSVSTEMARVSAWFSMCWTRQSIETGSTRMLISDITKIGGISHINKIFTTFSPYFPSDIFFNHIPFGKPT